MVITLQFKTNIIVQEANFSCICITSWSVANNFIGNGKSHWPLSVPGSARELLACRRRQFHLHIPDLLVPGAVGDVTEHLVKVPAEGQEEHQSRCHHHRAGPACWARVVPELDPGQQRHLEQEQEQAQHVGQRHAEVDEGAEAVMRRKVGHPSHPKRTGAGRLILLGHRFHARQQTRADHQRENVHGDQRHRVNCKQSEQPHWAGCVDVHLQLRHCGLKTNVHNIFRSF